MSDLKKPETREEDSWFSEAQLEKLAPADHADRVHSPIPTPRPQPRRRGYGAGLDILELGGLGQR